MPPAAKTSRKFISVISAGAAVEAGAAERGSANRNIPARVRRRHFM
jgi:hypothetical protein